MLQNNTVYKGYRLSAKIARPTAAVSGSPMFAATIVVGVASSAAEPGDSYDVPRFAHGAFVVSPGEAVHAAVLHGRTVVDGLQAKAEKPAQD